MSLATTTANLLGTAITFFVPFGVCGRSNSRIVRPAIYRCRMVRSNRSIRDAEFFGHIAYRSGVAISDFGSALVRQD